MMQKHVVSVVWLALFLLLGTLVPGVVFASSGSWNWIEVGKFTGDVVNLYETDAFNINSSVCAWRIIWEYTPRTDIAEDKTGLTIYVYNGASGTDKLIQISSTGLHNGNERTMYFHEQGVFRLKLNSNTQNFSVRVEKSLGYVPAEPSDNWVEVTRFIGSKGFNTDYFTVTHEQWRIRWEFDPGHWHFADLNTFKVSTYKQGEPNPLFDKIIEPPNGNQQGVKLLNQSGSFHLKIENGLIDFFTIIIEENIESIPELPTWTILPVLVIATSTIAIYQNKVRRKHP